MGMPSISILLHELIKLMHHAACTDVIFTRMGTCGGLGLAPGTVVITDSAVNEMFQPVYQMVRFYGLFCFHCLLLCALNICRLILHSTNTYYYYLFESIFDAWIYEI